MDTGESTRQNHQQSKKRGLSAGNVILQHNFCKFGCNECNLLDNPHCRRIMESGILHSDEHFPLYGIFLLPDAKERKNP